MMKSVFLPLSWIYDRLTAYRNRMYDDGSLQTHRFDVPVISIGNLTLGGTGKTPLMAELVSWAVARGLKTAVVSRGYKSAVKDVAQVPKEGASAAEFGDEPVMISRRFPQVPVFVGPSRVHVVTALLKQYPETQVIFADDAFQHRSLGRTLDIVVLDCTEPVENYRVVPAGRGRENVKGLDRADFVILNKVNLVSPEQKQAVLEMIENVRKSPVEIIESEYYVHELRQLTTGERCEPMGYEPVIAVSAIGNPRAFEDLLKMKLKVLTHLAFRDHHAYDDADMKKILAAAKEKGAKKIVITEKDTAKLERLNGINELFWVAELRPKLSLKIKSLFENILSHVR